MSKHENGVKAFIEGLSAPQLDEVKELADERLGRMRQIDELRARFEEQAATLGLNADAVINGVIKKKRRGLRPKDEASE